MVDNFSDVHSIIFLNLAHYARSCCSMMTHRYQEDHEFFIRCMQQPRDYRARVSTLGSVVSSSDEVLIGALIHQEPKSDDASPIAQQLDWKQSFHCEHPPCSETLLLI